MSKLSEKNHWEGQYSVDQKKTQAKSWRQVLKTYLGPLGQAMQPYHDRLFWRTFSEHLPATAGLKAIEIGSAPGKFLVQLHERFGYEPYGLEYTQAGSDENRKLFATHQISEKNVFEADFFDDSFRAAHKEEFDLVFSRGFIEHFSDPEKLVSSHLELLKPNGFLVISIPNLQGINLALTQVLNAPVVKIHNLKIMQLAAFSQLFENKPVRASYLGYLGTLNLSLAYAPEHSARRLLESVLGLAQRFANIFLNLTMPKKGVENAKVSPYLLFIGQKISRQ